MFDSASSVNLWEAVPKIVINGTGHDRNHWRCKAWSVFNFFDVILNEHCAVVTNVSLLGPQGGQFWNDLDVKLVWSSFLVNSSRELMVKSKLSKPLPVVLLQLITAPVIQRWLHFVCGQRSLMVTLLSLTGDSQDLIGEDGLYLVMVKWSFVNLAPPIQG